MKEAETRYNTWYRGKTDAQSSERTWNLAKGNPSKKTLSLPRPHKLPRNTRKHGVTVKFRITLWHLQANSNRRNSVVLVHPRPCMISGFAGVPLMWSDVSTSISPYLLSAEQQVDCPGPVGARLTKASLNTQTACLLFPEHASFTTQLPVLHKLSKLGGMPTASTPAMQSLIQSKTHLYNNRAIRLVFDSFILTTTQDISNSLSLNCTPGFPSILFLQRTSLQTLDNNKATVPPSGQWAETAQTCFLDRTWVGGVLCFME